MKKLFVIAALLVAVWLPVVSCSKKPEPVVIPVVEVVQHKAKPVARMVVKPAARHRITRRAPDKSVAPQCHPLDVICSLIEATR